MDLETELARVVGSEAFAVIRKSVYDASTRSTLASDKAMAIAIELAKCGVRADDMAVALSAVTRIQQFVAPRSPMEDVAHFVAQACAIGDLRGPRIYLVVDLARTATKLTQPQNGAP